jgi:hypothetical protein
MKTILKNNEPFLLVRNGVVKDLMDAPGGPVSIAYSDLKALRDGSSLVAGQWYRITDFVTTTVKPNTRSAGHQFDIIVRADDVNVLNENAYAALHSGDTYFAGSKLEAWQLKYSLDNDAARFDWAVPDGGAINCGDIFVRYAAGDVPGASYPYAWGTAGFHIFTASDTPQAGQTAYEYSDGTGGSIAISSVIEANGKGVVYYMQDESGNEFPYDFKNLQFMSGSARTVAGVLANVYYYTLSVVSGTNDATVEDHSLNGEYCYDNKMPVISDSLNGNVFRNTSTASECGMNTLGKGCYGNYFGDGCCNNVIGANCSYNVFGNSCSDNTLLQGASDNTFGASSIRNFIGADASGNTFGNNCADNVLQSYCHYNTFGTNCRGNNFGSGCSSNVLGNYCSSFTLGSDCTSVKTGTSGSPENYCRYITVDGGNSNVYLDCTATTSSSAYLQNIRIAHGVNDKTITHATAGDTFQTVYASANSKEVSV